jgi:glycosyltransferase involved in cell wall biosynthesis
VLFLLEFINGFLNMKKIGILSFSPFTIGGGQKMTCALAGILCENFDTHLIAFYEIGSVPCIDKKIRIISLNMPQESRVLFVLLKSFLKFKKYIVSQKIDILIISGSMPVPVVFFLKPFIKCKVIFWEHECIVQRDKKSLLFRKLACWMSDRIVTISKKTYNDYINILKYDENKIEIIYNFIEKEFYKNSFNYDLNSKLILSVGRLSREKGFDLAVKVSKKVFAEHPNWQWHIYGEGPERKNLEKLIAENYLEKNIILKGERKKIYNIFKNYSIFVLPSYREGFSLALLEAKASGLPSISFDCAAGPNEIIQNKVNGYLIECYNTEKMAEKIVYLIENPYLRIKFSENCRPVSEKFGKTNFLEKWENLIKKIS